MTPRGWGSGVGENGNGYCVADTSSCAVCRKARVSELLRGSGDRVVCTGVSLSLMTLGDSRYRLGAAIGGMAVTVGGGVCGVLFLCLVSHSVRTAESLKPAEMRRRMVEFTLKFCFGQERVLPFR